MATDTHLERELKFSVGPEFDLPDLRPLVGRSVRLPERSFRTTYFDTSDLRLWNRGITLRYRNDSVGGPGAWTVKLPEASEGTTLDRTELSWPGTREEVPAEARELLQGVIRRVPIDQVVEMNTVRLPWTLHDHAGARSAELDYDDVTVAGGPRDGLRYRQIEIERSGDSDDERLISKIADALQRAGADRDDQPKLAKALALSARRRRAPSKKAARRATAADVVRGAVSDGFERLVDHDHRLRLRLDDPDPEDIHQARVATRRLRSHLKTLETLLDPIWLAHTTDELQWLGRALGAVRDADVMDASFASTAASNPAFRGWPGLGDVRARLAAQRAEALTDLGAALGSQRYLDLLDRLHAAASHPPLTAGSDKVRKPLRAEKALPRAVRKRWRTIEKRFAAGGRTPSDEQLHRIRIAAKNLRYASELSSPVIGKPARRTARRAEKLQTILGEHHDASTSIDWLAGAGGFAAGVLAAEQERRRSKLARRWRREWHRLARAAGRGWPG